MSEVTYSLSEEIWGDLTLNEAMTMMDISGDLEEGNSFFSGKLYYPKASEFIFDSMADFIKYRIEDHVDDNTSGENSFSANITSEAKAELLTFIKDWSDKHISIPFQIVDEMSVVVITQQMIDEYNTTN